MSKMPLDLFLREEVQMLLDHLADLLDLRVTFFSNTGECLRRGKAMRNCDYCHLIQTTFGGWEKCISMDNDKQTEALKQHGIIAYRCHAGLRECLAPVYIHDVPVGFIMFGQFRLESDTLPEMPDATPAQKRKLAAAFDALPCFSESRMNALLGMLKILIDYITVREFAVLKSDHLRTEIDLYIARFATEDIRLPDMARHLGKSVSAISQFLRKKYNTTFKTLLLNYRLKLVEKYWQHNINASVAEVAFNSGFRDQFYFSRVFHRHYGMPPAKFRNAMRPAKCAATTGKTAKRAAVKEKANKTAEK